MEELRVYLVTLNSPMDKRFYANADIYFVAEKAEEQGTVFTLQGFAEFVAKNQLGDWYVVRFASVKDGEIVQDYYNMTA